MRSVYSRVEDVISRLTETTAEVSTVHSGEGLCVLPDITPCHALKSALFPLAALQALKRKKRYEKQLAQIDGTLSTIEFQREALENANTNTEVLKNMGYAAKAMKAAHDNMYVPLLGSGVWRGMLLRPWPGCGCHPLWNFGLCLPPSVPHRA